MKTRTLLKTLAPAALLVAARVSPAAAQQPPYLPDFVHVTFDPSCGATHAQVPHSGPNRGSLVVQLDDFSTEASQELTASRSCHIAAVIDVQPGMTFRSVRAFADGEVSTSESGRAEVSMTYEYSTGGPTQERTAFEAFSAGTSKTYSVGTGIHDPALWVGCYEGAPRQAHLDGDLVIRAERGPSDRRNSDISVYNTEGQAVRWMWEWGSCGFNEKLFRSRYTNPHGIWIQGTTKLVGNHGEYTTDSGGHGIFEGVRYPPEEHGRVAQGFWVYEGRDRGWFLFRIDEDGAGFTGTWGYGEEPGAGEMGRWRGDQVVGP